MKDRNCEICGKVFVARSARKTCGRSCAIKLSWRDQESAAKRRASIKLARRTPESRAKSTETNNRRWARPGEREKLSERNKKMWSKPRTRKKLVAAIAAVNRTPEKRLFYSNLRRSQWADPEYRQKTTNGIKRSKGSPEAREMFSKLLRERWEDPEMRAKYTAANSARNNDEHRERNRQRMLRRWRDDNEFRAIVASTMEFYWSRPEAREQNSARMRALWADPIWRMRQMRILENAPGCVNGGKVYKHLNIATDLMVEVDSVIPKGLPEFMRADIASDITLALLEGELKYSDLKAEANAYMTAHRKMFPDKWGPISIDAPIPGTDGFTIADTLSNETEHF